MLDFLIEVDPDQPTIDMYERYLLRRVPGYSPLNGWIESQRAYYPGVGWDAVTDIMNNEAPWHGVPMRWRQHAAMFNFAMQSALADEINTEGVLAVVEKLDGLADRFPVTKTWDAMRGAYAVQLFDQGDPLFAMDLARSIRGPKSLGYIIKYCMTHGFPDEARELSARFAAQLELADVQESKTTLEATE